MNRLRQENGKERKDGKLDRKKETKRNKNAKKDSNNERKSGNWSVRKRNGNGTLQRNSAHDPQEIDGENEAKAEVEVGDRGGDELTVRPIIPTLNR